MSQRSATRYRSRCEPRKVCKTQWNETGSRGTIGGRIWDVAVVLELTFKCTSSWCLDSLTWRYMKATYLHLTRKTELGEDGNVLPCCVQTTLAPNAELDLGSLISSGALSADDQLAGRRDGLLVDTVSDISKSTIHCAGDNLGTWNYWVWGKSGFVGRV